MKQKIIKKLLFLYCISSFAAIGIKGFDVSAGNEIEQLLPEVNFLKDSQEAIEEVEVIKETEEIQQAEGKKETESKIETEIEEEKDGKIETESKIEVEIKEETEIEKEAEVGRETESKIETETRENLFSEEEPDILTKTIGNLAYEVNNDGTITIISCDKSAEKVEIPERIDGMIVTQIGDNAFYDCNRLEKVTIPRSVNSIGNNAFYWCSKLTEVTLPVGVTKIGDNTFYGCYNLAKVTIPNGVTSIGNSAFYWCSSLTQITLPEGITEIGSNAFYWCSGLTEITFPQSITSIGNNAFGYCLKLTQVIIPGNVENMGRNIFLRCSNLKELVLSEGITSFEWNHNGYFCKVTIPKSVTKISLSDCVEIYGYRGSAAETYAKDNKLSFISLEAEEPREIETYTVKTSEELLKAIGSYRKIILEDGLYTLPDTLEITKAKALTIEAENSGMAEILVEKKENPAIEITYSADIAINGCIIGHKAEKENIKEENTETEEENIKKENTKKESDWTSAYVLSIQSSNDIKVEKCDLYGGGIEGLSYSLVQRLSLQDCVIRDCKGSAVLGDGQEIQIDNCIISGNAFYDDSYAKKYALLCVSEATLQNCTFLNNYNQELEKGEGVVLENCTFYNNVWDKETPGEYGICLNGITWQVEEESLKIGYPLKLKDNIIIESTQEEVLNYSDFSVPWKEFQDKTKTIAQEIPIKLVDVPDNWMLDAVKYVYTRGIMTGKAKDKIGNIVFEPDSELTREQFAQIIYAMEGKPEVNYNKNKKKDKNDKNDKDDEKFLDVDKEQWYANAVLWITEQGIASGYGDTFGVGKSITRQELVAMLYKYAVYKGYDTSASASLNKFYDADKAARWAVPQLRWAVANKIMTGKGSNLDPTGTATRAECAAMLRVFLIKFEPSVSE